MSKDSVEGDSAAIEITDDLLYRSGSAVITKDFDALASCFALPHTIETCEGQWQLETEEALRQLFENVCEYYATNNVTNVVRTVIESEFIDDDTIGSTHVSLLMRDNGEAFRKPYPTYIILKKTHDGWKATSSSYAILDAPDHNDALAFAATLQKKPPE